MGGSILEFVVMVVLLSPFLAMAKLVGPKKTEFPAIGDLVLVGDLDAPGNPDKSTKMRWATHGIVVHGRRIKLWSVKAGGRRYSTAAAVQEFIAATDESPAERLASEGC